MLDGIQGIDVRTIADMPVGYEELMRLAIDYADAVIITTPNHNTRLVNYAENRGKFVRNMVGAEAADHLALYKELLEQ